MKKQKKLTMPNFKKSRPPELNKFESDTSTNVPEES